MSQNIGTLVSSAIRPNDSLDQIASAFANEIKGGSHGYETYNEMIDIIEARREWGMLVTVYNDPVPGLNGTYQLKYGNTNNNVFDISDDSNWVKLNLSDNASTEWVDSVISISSTEPTLVPNPGDRYLLGTIPNLLPSGTNWQNYSYGTIIVEYSNIGTWKLTIPTNGMTVRVDNDNNSIYKYEGNYPTGIWKQEKTTQVFYIEPTSIGGLTYSVSTDPIFNAYSRDLIFLTKFNTANTGTASININGLGYRNIKIATKNGVRDLIISDIVTNGIYSLTYNGTYFQMTKPFPSDSYNIEYYIGPGEVVTVQEYEQYWVYGDLTIDGGVMQNYGHVVVANGSVNLVNSGVFNNNGSGELILVDLFNTPIFNTTDTIQLSSVMTINGPSVSAIVLNNSLTPSHINSVNTATASYVLSNNGSSFEWVAPTSTLNLTSLATDLIPATDSVYSLGSSASKWESLHVSGNTIYIGGVTLSTSGDSLVVGSINLGTTASPLIISANNNTLVLNGTSSVITFTGYDDEIHVSQIDGNDTTGDGGLLNPVATITHALTLVTGVRKTIIIHPGNYNESPSITVQSTVLNSYSPLGGTTFIQGTLTTSVGCTIAGFQIGNLNITTPSGVGDPHIIDCTITGTLTKSGSATYTEIHHCDINTACNVTGSGLVTIDDCNLNFLTVNNAGANTLVRNCQSCVSPVLLSGTLNLINCIVIAYATNGITTSAGSIITIADCQIVTTALNAVAPIVLNGFYSIFNVVYDKPNSTLVASSGTGGTTNSIDYFQYINADKFIKQGGTYSEYLMADGTVSLGPSLAGYVPYNGATGPVNLGNFNLTVNNISVGKGAGTGVDNTAVGNLALSSATTGYNNTAFGSGALKSVTDGNFNTAIGYNALKLGTTMSYCLAIGWSAGENHFTSQGSVVFIGYLAGRSNTTGFNNTAVGNQSLLSNTTGFYNAAVGDSTLYHNTTGTNNTALGSQALTNNTIGSNNISIGHSAGVSAANASGNTSSNQSIFLGANTRPLNGNDSNQIVIGHGVFGAGTNTVTIGDTNIVTTRLRGVVQGGSFVKDGGTASQYLMADGSVTTPYKYNFEGSLTLTGTLTTTNLLTITIPANSLSDYLNIRSIMVQQSGPTLAGFQIRVWHNSVNDFNTATRIANYAFGSGGADLFAQMTRKFSIQSGQLFGFPWTPSNATGDGSNTNAALSIPFNTTVINYLFISIQLTNITDTATLRNVNIVT